MQMGLSGLSRGRHSDWERGSNALRRREAEVGNARALSKELQF